MNVNILNSVARTTFASMNLDGDNWQANPNQHHPAGMSSHSHNDALVTTAIQGGILDKVDSYEKTESGILIPTMKGVSFLSIPKIEILRPELNSSLVMA